jgi:hypothetical protein
MFYKLCIFYLLNYPSLENYIHFLFGVIVSLLLSLGYNYKFVPAF